ncbi:uncharacterized protein LOC124357324 isoform X1 [Homalodisca vitripennis]|uniref:uncharacterized protein LOC124357324 isoform X1 n=2 Tax=Homalodisca vitripennis TaxID=197043 RepID=UPI001EEA19BD|nr:uncharacterized protein LOC124357324 isoform X1 [Homalodisca vitripennis]
MPNLKIFFSVLLIATALHNSEPAALYNSVMNKMFASVSKCTREVNGKISPELCLMEFDGIHNPNDPQFDGCKAAMTCAFKKLDYMHENGKWNQDKLLSLRNGIKNQDALREFDQTFETCGSVGGTNGEAVINMITCVLNSSNRAKQSYNELKDTFMSGYDE